MNLNDLNPLKYSIKLLKLGIEEDSNIYCAKNCTLYPLQIWNWAKTVGFHI